MQMSQEGRKHLLPLLCSIEFVPSRATAQKDERGFCQFFLMRLASHYDSSVDPSVCQSVRPIIPFQFNGLSVRRSICAMFLKSSKFAILGYQSSIGKQYPLVASMAINKCGFHWTGAIKVVDRLFLGSHNILITL